LSDKGPGFDRVYIPTSDAELALAGAKTSLIQAQAAVHTTKLASISQLSNDATSKAHDAKALAVAKIEESTFRRQAMGAVLTLIGPCVLSLFLLKRRLDSDLERHRPASGRLPEAHAVELAPDLVGVLHHLLPLAEVAQPVRVEHLGRNVGRRGQPAAERMVAPRGQAGHDVRRVRREGLVGFREAVVERPAAEEPERASGELVPKPIHEPACIPLPHRGVQGAAKDDGVPVIEVGDFAGGHGEGPVAAVAQALGHRLGDLRCRSQFGRVGD
jgi:hypothetical protein